MGFFDMLGKSMANMANDMLTTKVSEYRRISKNEIEDLIPFINNKTEQACAIIAIAHHGDIYKAVSLAKENNISKNFLTKFATNRQWGEVIRRMIKEYDK